MHNNSLTSTKTNNAIFSLSSSTESDLFHAKTLELSGQTEAAVAAYIQIIDSGTMPIAHSALLELGALNAKVRSAEVLTFVENKAAKENALQLTAMHVVAGFYKAAGQAQKALKWFEKISTTAPGSAEDFNARMNRFHIYFLLKDFAAAAMQLDQTNWKTTDDFADLASAAALLQNEFPGYVLKQKGPREANSDGPVLSSGQTFSLKNYPNPFNPRTNIQFELPQKCAVVLKLYDLRGRLIRQLLHASLVAGRHKIPLDGSDMASGTYVYTLEVNGVKESSRLTVLK